MSDQPILVRVLYSEGQSGLISVPEDANDSAIWARLKLAARARSPDCIISNTIIRLSWPDTLNLIRELGSKATQRNLNFRFKPEGEAVSRLKQFTDEIIKTRRQRDQLVDTVSEDEITERLKEYGFTKRQLKPFQIRDLQKLLALSNGANFSVPGAGKTTVTFALHILTRKPSQQFMVVAPKAATQAWLSIVSECMAKGSSSHGDEPFTVLDGDENQTLTALNSGASRFIISYEMMVRQQAIISTHIATTPTHLVLDESHRMKAGWLSQRGALLLNIAALPVRRDILTGTPMPQSARDIESQLDFLWPGHGLGMKVVQGTSPRDVLGDLYARTTKKELGLPEVKRHFIDVRMNPGQLALYSVVRNEFLREFSKGLSSKTADYQFLRARRSVMRLLQLSINPVLALNAMANDDLEVESLIADQVLEEGHSAKMKAVIDHARELSHNGEKSVIWTIFTDTIQSFSSSLADLGAVYIHGGVPSGSDLDANTREGKIRRFHEDDDCSVLIANPAAAGEGISLHTVCHNALYADRSYVSTHYLQSIDRIHRLGLSPDQETNIFVYRTKAPPQVGSIDMSVSRRLTEKIRNMQELLDDPDLHQLALDEEEADDPIDYDVRLQDIIDLIAEFEGRSPSVTSGE